MNHAISWWLTQAQLARCTLFKSSCSDSKREYSFNSCQETYFLQYAGLNSSSVAIKIIYYPVVLIYICIVLERNIYYQEFFLVHCDTLGSNVSYPARLAHDILLESLKNFFLLGWLHYWSLIYPIVYPHIKECYINVIWTLIGMSHSS